MKIMLAALSVLFALDLPVATAADKVGKDLLNYFSSTCPSQGDWTKLVISDSEALMSILENIKADPDCVSAAGSISQLGGLANKISQLQRASATKIEIEKLKAMEFELSSQLQGATDPFVIGEIQGALRGIQVQKASLIAEENSKDELAGDNIVDTYSQIVLSTNQFYKSISNSSRCLDKNPRIISSVTSLVASIGGAVTTVNPALGLGLSAGSEILGQTVEAVRIRKINRQIRKIADGTLINSGFKCALESLSNRWCELSDARKIYEFKFNLISNPPQDQGFLSIVSIYDRKIPSFLEWLSKVRAGAPAATESDATRHEVVYDRWKIVQVASSKGDGILTEFKSRYDDPTTSTTADKYNIIRQVISKLTGQCSSGISFGSTTANPLFDIYNSSFAPYKLLGLEKIPTTAGFPIDFCSFDPITQWPTGSYVPDYALLEKEYKEWIRKTTVLVNKEFTQVLQPDALGVLTLALEKTGSKWKISPKQSIDELIKFLKTNQPASFESSGFKKIYLDTINRLELISSTLTDALIVGNLDARKAIESIFTTADLQYGTVVFSSRLDMAVRISLDQYFRNSTPEDQNIAAQMLAMESYIETLKKVSGKDTDELVMLDIQGAQKGALSNLRNFMNVFGKNINQLLQQDDKRIRASADPSQRKIDEEDQAKLCVLLASMPQHSEKISLDLCKGKQLTSFMRGGPASPLITDEYLKKDFSVRNCSYRDHIRKSKIYREWNIKL